MMLYWSESTNSFLPMIFSSSATRKLSGMEEGLKEKLTPELLKVVELSMQQATRKGIPLLESSLSSLGFPLSYRYRVQR